MKKIRIPKNKFTSVFTGRSFSAVEKIVKNLYIIKKDSGFYIIEKINIFGVLFYLLFAPLALVLSLLEGLRNFLVDYLGEWKSILLITRSDYCHKEGKFLELLDVMGLEIVEDKIKTKQETK